MDAFFPAWRPWRFRRGATLPPTFCKMSCSKDMKPFRYRDRGRLAVIGRSFAVADLPGIRLSGFTAWAAWVLVHIYFLIGFRNRLFVIIQWTWAYLTYDRGARLITGK